MTCLEVGKETFDLKIKKNLLKFYLIQRATENERNWETFWRGATL